MCRQPADWIIGNWSTSQLVTWSMVNRELYEMLSVIRYSLYGELQPITRPNLELETWNLEL
jgi:hypothetical protein